MENTIRWCDHSDASEVGRTLIRTRAGHRARAAPDGESTGECQMDGRRARVWAEVTVPARAIDVINHTAAEPFNHRSCLAHDDVRGPHGGHDQRASDAE